MTLGKVTDQAELVRLGPGVRLCRGVGGAGREGVGLPELVPPSQISSRSPGPGLAGPPKQAPQAPGDLSPQPDEVGGESSISGPHSTCPGAPN